MFFCLSCPQCTHVLFSETSSFKAGYTYPGTGCVSMPTFSARTLRYDRLADRRFNELKLSDWRGKADKLIRCFVKSFDWKSLRVTGWLSVSHPHASAPEALQQVEPWNTDASVIYNLNRWCDFLCFVLLFSWCPGNRSCPEMWATIGFLFRLHSSHTEWNCTRFPATTDCSGGRTVLLRSRWCLFITKPMKVL